MAIKVPLSQQGKHAGQYVALIDDIDKDLLDSRWRVFIKTTIQYARLSDGDMPMMHNIIAERMGLSGKNIIHLNNDGLDNRRNNLAVASNSERGANAKLWSHNKTGYRGVCVQSGRFKAQICVNGERKYLGLFDTVEEAAIAYNEAALEHFGEFAYQNEIEYKD